MHKEGAIVERVGVLMLSVWRRTHLEVRVQLFACQRAVNKAQNGGWLHANAALEASETGGG